MYRPRRVVITGGSSGLGLNFALEFAARHSELFLLARSVQGLEQAGEQIERRFPGTKVTTFAADVSDVWAIRAVAESIGAGGDIDLLINSAGILHEGYVDSVEDEVFRAQMEVNFFGTVHAVRAFLPPLRRTKGRIVNISSLCGLTSVFGYSAYCSSKYAVQGFSEVLRLELKPAGVAVHVVCPGAFESPMLAKLGTQCSPENLAHTGSGAERITTQVVVDATLRGIEAGKFEIVPGAEAQFVRALVRHLPAFIHWASDRTVRPVYVGPVGRS
jgi:3-dehydrosphinganine reductase